MQASTVWIFNEVVYWFIGVFMKQCFKGTDGVQPRLELLASIQLSIDSTRLLIVVVRSFALGFLPSLLLALPLCTTSSFSLSFTKNK